MLFISLEGGEGSGKSTQAACLQRLLAERGVPAVFVREPGSTQLGEVLRQVLVGPAGTAPPITPWAEALMYTAAPSQLVAEIIRPALAEGKWVVSDRYIDSTLAYQGYGLGLPVAELRSLNVAATGRLWPRLTLLFDVSASQGLARSGGKDQPPDRIEARGLEFHDRVNSGYHELARAEPGRWQVIPAGVSVKQAQELVAQIVISLLKEVQP